MNRKSLLVLAVVALMTASSLTAQAQPTRFEIPAAGTQFVCGSQTYTMESGAIEFQVHERANKTSVTVKFRDVEGTNAEGETVRHVGAETVSIHQGSDGEKFHQAFNIVLVSKDGGGRVGSVKGVITINPKNGLEEARFSGECDGPFMP